MNLNKTFDIYLLLMLVTSNQASDPLQPLIY